MENKLHFYHSELKSKNIPKYKVIGIVSEILLSKELFSKNEDIPFFLNEIFSITYKEYVLKSRTTIVARCIRDIYSVDDKLFETYRKNLLNFVKLDVEIKPINKRKNDSIHKWMDGINE